ncbi:MAG TPA: radical SAM protein [Planctomycetota bacterium]|nr:radical SAM protein [Planctomycetota bacterium]
MIPAEASAAHAAFDDAQALAARFPDVPLEAVVKEDLLRRGVRFTAAALGAFADYAAKTYFIFTFNRAPLAELSPEERDAAPEEISLSGGPFGFRRVVVSVRLNPASPWVVDLREGRVALVCGSTVAADVGFAPRPPYYGGRTDDGFPLTEVAPSIEWGYLLYLTVFRVCQYFGKDEECRFCDINHNFRQQREAGRPYASVKPVARVLDALRRVVASGATPQAYTLTGGSVTSTLDGLDEASFYVRYAEAIEAEFPGRWIGKAVVQALPQDQVRRLKAAGLRIYHPNYEVWDRDLFEKLCPGKARYVGRDAWVSRVCDAVDVFGPGCVIPNFVAGIETARPYGFTSTEAALASTGEGLRYFMKRGVLPRFTTWCPEPFSELGSCEPAPLEYHVGLLSLYRRTLAEELGMAPPGYGPPGLGRAVFSVSAFMDVLDPDMPVAPFGP